MDIISCEFPDGAKTQLRHTGVDMLLINEQAQVLLIKRSEHVSRSHKYALPGGYVDRDEDVKTAAVREVLEETGYHAEASYLFCINDQTDLELRKDNRQNVLLLFVGKVLDGEKKLNREVSEIRWFSLNELPSEEEFAFDHRKIILKYFEHIQNPLPLPLFAKDL